MSENAEKAKKKQRRLANLKPYKKGESGNLKGRPEGIPNRSTVAKKVLEMLTEPPEKIKESLRQSFPRLFKGKNEKQTTEMLMSIRIALKALADGDVSAYNAIMDSAYGKAKIELELSKSPEFNFDEFTEEN